MDCLRLQCKQSFLQIGYVKSATSARGQSLSWARELNFVYTSFACASRPLKGRNILKLLDFVARLVFRPNQT